MGCTATAPDNGSMGTCPTNMSHNATCTQNCNPGYTISGTATCSNGTFTSGSCIGSLPWFLQFSVFSIIHIVYFLKTAIISIVAFLAENLKTAVNSENYVNYPVQLPMTKLPTLGIGLPLQSVPHEKNL